MAGKLDQISYQLGEMRARIDALRLDVKEDRAVAAVDRLDIRDRLRNIDERVRKLEPLVSKVEAMEPQVEDYKMIRQKIAVAIVIVGSITWGATYLIWQGVASFGPELRDALIRLFK